MLENDENEMNIEKENNEKNPDAPMTENIDLEAWEQAEDAAAQLTGNGDNIEADIITLQEENTKLKDAMLRALADAENTRKRSERQIADGRIFAINNFARDLLSVVDNLRRALSSLPEEEQDEKSKNILTGVEMTEKELIKALEKNNVKEVETQNTLFDPNLHEAMFEIPNPDVPSGTILNVVEPGWTIGDRLLRPARVGIAKGGPKPKKENTPPAES